MRELMDLVKSEGSPQRGEEIYRRSQLLCQSCHAIAGAGGAIGPDLVSLGSSAPIDYIVDSLLEPAKKIKEGYHTTVITTKQGEVITGGLVRDSDSELVIRMVDGSFKNIKTSAIEKKEISPVSLMPPGLTASLRKDEFIDLMSFLSALGKEGEYKVPPGRSVRRWRTLPKDSKTSGLIKTKGIQYTLNGKNNLPWKPVYSFVDGGLPLAEMGINNGFNNRLSIAKFEIEVSIPGKIGIRIKNPEGLQLLTGGEMIEAKKNSSFTFSQGRHEIYVIVDNDIRESHLFIEIVDVDGSQGVAELVTGL
jgi:putative heme-binding domain-containing protein